MLLTLLVVVATLRCLESAQPRIIEDSKNSKYFLEGGFSENLPNVISYNKNTKLSAHPRTRAKKGHENKNSKSILRLSKHIDSKANAAEVNKFVIVVPDESSGNNTVNLEKKSINMTHIDKNVDTIYVKGQGHGPNNEHKFEEHEDKGNSRHKERHKENEKDLGHNKEARISGKYKENSERDKKFQRGRDYFAGHGREKEEEHGTEFEEDGEMEKGYDTHGSQNFRKKDEYVKKIEFFDEFHDSEDKDRDDGNEDDEDFYIEDSEKKEHLDDVYDEEENYATKEDEVTVHDKLRNTNKHSDGHDENHDEHNKLAVKDETNPLIGWKSKKHK